MPEGSGGKSGATVAGRPLRPALAVGAPAPALGATLGKRRQIDSGKRPAKSPAAPAGIPAIDWRQGWRGKAVGAHRVAREEPDRTRDMACQAAGECALLIVGGSGSGSGSCEALLPSRPRLGALEACK